MHLQTRAKNPKLSFLFVSVLCLCFCALFLRHLLMSPSSEESQIYSALGCRSSDTVLILRVSSDGMVHGHDDTIRTVEDTALLLPEIIRRAENPILAIMADADTSMSLVRPLLAVAENLGHRRAIFALNHGSPLALLSDQHGKPTPSQ